LEAEDIVTLQEYLGYLLIPSTKGQAMLSIIGTGGEGKSVLGTVLKEIFGDSMTEGSFRRIETDRFFRANLKGKLVFVDDDLQLEALPSTGYIKSLITVQIPTDIEFKGKQSYSEKLYARFLCFGNGTVKSLYDKSAGFSRRMIILTAKSISEGRTVNPNLAEEIISEKDGVFNWMFAGLQRLIARNYRFSLSAKAKLNAAEMISDNCNIIEFLGDENCVTFDSGAEISSTNLYGGYSDWCDENAITPIKRETFINWLKSNQSKYGVIYTTHIKSEARYVRGFKGVSVCKRIS
jgi:putative DNA primase/helicase